jgi:hypothetical protein
LHILDISLDKPYEPGARFMKEITTKIKKGTLQIGFLFTVFLKMVLICLKRI